MAADIATPSSSSAGFTAGPVVLRKTCTFQSLGISKWLIEQCVSMGIRNPTSVQSNCIPQILENRDVLGCAKTGTGKTLAFALPILQTLAVDPHGIFALILTPTRELASQIADQFLALGKPLALRLSVVIGGRDMVIQASELQKRPHIVIATPGRLFDHIETSGTGEMSRVFARIKYLVLDEADRLLSGQYMHQLKEIFSVCPKSRQTLLFSATLTDALDRLHQVSVKKPYLFEDKSPDTLKTVDTLEQRYVLCPVDYKDAYLVYVVKNLLDRRSESSVLVFAETCRECQALADMFSHLKMRCGCLHSQCSQQDRLNSLTNFRANKVRILICTDVASRGLDIPTVDLVVNHNVPRDPSIYIHRVGRSARAGRFGSALTLVTQYDVVLLQNCELVVGRKMDELKVSDTKVCSMVTEVLVAKREAEVRLDKRNFGEKREINRRKQMAMEGLSPKEVDEAISVMKNRRKEISKKRLEKVERSATHAEKKSNIAKVVKRSKKSKRKHLPT